MSKGELISPKKIELYSQTANENKPLLKKDESGEDGENKENVGESDTEEGEGEAKGQDAETSSVLTTSMSQPSLASLKPVPNKSQSTNVIDDTIKDDEEMPTLQRSKTMPFKPGSPTPSRKSANSINVERLKNAKDLAEKSIKIKRVFTIQGPYPAIRQALRRRGWVEKFYKLHMAPTAGPGGGGGGGGSSKKSPRVKKRKTTTSDAHPNDSDYDDDDDADDDDDDDTDDPNDHGGKIPPWEEEGGIYGIMSRIVRNSNPTFIWGVRRDVVDPKALKKEQMINHYGKATFTTKLTNHYDKAPFTTKVGLCLNMRNVPWFEPANPDTFFPRCYRLSSDEEKEAFIDDFRQTACLNLLKWVLQRHEDGTPSTDQQEDEEQMCTNADCTRSRPNSERGNRCPHVSEVVKTTSKDGETTEGCIDHSDVTTDDVINCDVTKGDDVTAEETADCCDCDTNTINNKTAFRPNGTKRRKKGGYVPLRAVQMALKQARKQLKASEHNDIDEGYDAEQMMEPDWEQFIQWYYRVIHEDAVITHTHTVLDEVKSVLGEVKQIWPQYELDGIQNVWIVKPGAKSRGRGITCFDRLEDMLKLVCSTVVKKESKYVVQKYIERPLLIHGVKFDIRQWFLVTDWNPLTIWFYKDSYLRFCSVEYTLDDLDEAIHLSNNAVQCKYESKVSSKHPIPSYLMWSSDEFQDYLKQRGYDRLWEDVIYPGMKKAVLCALLCTQDIVEYRKGAFELYGADFMLTEDFRPWLIEINSSPSMSYSTPVTQVLCEEVLEDTVKVVLDRKADKNADTGKFELAFKQPQVTVPPYIGINLTVEGSHVRKPSWMIPQKTEIAPITSRLSVNNLRTAVSADESGSDRKDSLDLTSTSYKTPKALKMSTVTNSRSVKDKHRAYKMHYGGSEKAKISSLLNGRNGRSQRRRNGSTNEDGDSNGSTADDNSDTELSPEEAGKQQSEHGGGEKKKHSPSSAPVSTQSPAAATKSTALTDTTAAPAPRSVRYLFPLSVEGAWSRPCNQCGSGSNLRLGRPATASSPVSHPTTHPALHPTTRAIIAEEQCACQKDSVRILDWSKVHAKHVTHTAFALPLPKPPPYNPRTCPALPAPPPRKIPVDRDRLLTTVYKSCNEYRANKKLNGRVVLRYTDASIIQPSANATRIQGQFGFNTFPKLTTTIISKSTGNHVKPSQTSITNGFDPRSKLSICNTHFY